MTQITVGQAAGAIAAAIFIARILVPGALTLILSWLLGDRNTAATWTVSASAFHTSAWPFILRSDNSQTHSVRPIIRLVTGLVTWALLLIAVAGIITPLGLYDEFVQTRSVQVTFKYLPDTSPFGIGTPPRSNLSFSRICGGFGPIVCPFSDTVVVAEVESTGETTYKFPYGYNLSVPQFIYDAFSSGTTENTTISNFFDIQWRRYYTASNPIYDNGSAWLVSGFTSMQSLIMDTEVQVVEGLVVDMVNGSVGLRNHTFPPGYQYGATWSEDLLFVQPDTVCVNTNLTIDYTISTSPNISELLTNLVLTDRGGFVNLNSTYPEPDLTNPQASPDLWTRAYKAAWLNNAFTALFYNVTDDNDAKLGTTAFSYMNSAINKTFPLPSGPLGDNQQFSSFLSSQDFGNLLELDTTLPNISNPFNIQSSNFSDISILCGGAGGADFANITNIFVLCGFIQGAPQRQDAGSNLIFESGSSWSQPLYTCASAVKATIKTVTFKFNGTGDVLSQLVVTNIQDKEYPDDQSMPLWGVENNGNAYYMRDVSLVWGLISEAYAKSENISAIQQPSLYIPGYDVDAEIFTIGYDNMPGNEAFLGAMGPPYTVSLSANGVVDYTGVTNIQMWSRWQALSKSAEGIANIINLIWADTAASAVVGTKGVLGPGNTQSKNVMPILVTPTVQQVKYHLPYAIPAIIMALVLLLITAAALLIILFSHNSISRLRLHLQSLSPGRIFTAFLTLEPNAMSMRSREWAVESGDTMIDLSGELPAAEGHIGKIEQMMRVCEEEVSTRYHSQEQQVGEIHTVGYEQLSNEEDIVNLVSKRRKSYY